MSLTTTNKTENTGSRAADQLLTIQGLASRVQVAAVAGRCCIMAGQATAGQSKIVTLQTAY
jgi:hypothetical protein